MTVLRTVADSGELVNAPKTPAAGRAAIIALLEPALDRLALVAADTIIDEVPAYRDRTDPELNAQVAIHCHAVFQVVLACIREDRGPTEADFPVTRSNAQSRVGQAIPLADFLHAFRLAQLVFCDHLITGVQEREALHSVALGAMSRLMRVIEVGSCVAAETYLEAERYGAAVGEQATRDLLDDLLGGHEPVIEARVGLLRAAGLGGSTPFAVLTIATAAQDEAGTGIGATELAEIVGVVRRSYGRAAHGLIVAYDAEVVGIVSTGRSVEQVGTILEIARYELAGRGIEAAIGISTNHTSLAEVPTAYRESVLARAALGRRSGVLALDSMSSFDYLLLSEDATARRLIDPRIAQFVEGDLAAGGTYLETIDAYVSSDLNAKVAADMLNLHVNTAYYRLDRIAERTGRDMRKLTEVLDLMIAVRLLAPARRRVDARPTATS